MLSHSKFPTWLAWMYCVTNVPWQVGSFKLSSIPLNTTGPDAGNMSEGDQNVSELLAKTVVGEMKDFGYMPDPKDKGEMGGAIGELGKSLEFLMLKVAQLETLAELQQTELGMAQKELGEQRTLIEKLQKKVDPDEAEVQMAQKQKSSEERVQEAHDVLKRVVQKHAHQREHREYDPETHKKPKQAVHADEEEELEEEEVSEGVSPGQWPRSLLQKREGREGLIPFIPTPGLRRRIEKKIEEGAKYLHKGVDEAVKAVDGTGLTGGALTEAYNAAKDAGNAAEFVANTAISTVEMAVSILTAGFDDWGATCNNAAPSLGMNGRTFEINFGRQRCKVSLMNQEMTLYDFNWGKKTVNLPALPEKVQKVADGNVKDLLPNPLKIVADGNIQNLLPNPLKNIASGDIMGLLPGQLKKITDGNIMGLLPGKLNKIADGNIMGLLPNPLKTIADGNILQLIPAMEVLSGGKTNSLQNMLTLGDALLDCSGSEESELVKCLGIKIISNSPPLNFLNRLGDIFEEFVGSFSKVAAALSSQAMKNGQSLLQAAATSEFPKAGAPAVVHHQTPNFIISKHSQRAARNAVLLQRDDDDDDPQAAVSWSFSDYGPEIRTLVTQFDGKETSTGSCLAFAPRNKTGSNNQATKEDWQAASEDDFVKLEPWAVPCSNKWMKDNWDKWQGYSFYTSDMQIEKCVTVTFQLNMQPVIAFVGGIQFDLLPGPLAEVNTQVCWPQTQPGGLDLSVLRSEIKSNGILLFSRTLRLSKRFGEANGESSDGMASIKRSSLLESNRSLRREGEKVQESLYWKTEEDDLYVASVEYGQDLGVNTTSKSQGRAAEEVIRRSEE
ncbi:unnamed protein product, partial [Symbiodinium sp. CCMP2456]